MHIHWAPSRPLTEVICPQQPRAVGMDCTCFRAVEMKLMEVKPRGDREHSLGTPPDSELPLLSAL